MFSRRPHEEGRATSAFFLAAVIVVTAAGALPGADALNIRKTNMNSAGVVPADEHEVEDKEPKLLSRSKKEKSTKAGSTSKAKDEPLIVNGEISEPVAEVCACVNEGVDKFSAPGHDALNQAWLNETADVNGTFDDTQYGKKYFGTYGGLPNYGEYCLEWDSECPGKDGRTGDKTECAVTAATAATECAADTSTLPANCLRMWCFIRTHTALNGFIARDAGSEAPQCTNVDDVAKITENGKDLYYSYNLCYATTTTTTPDPFGFFLL
ncbi:unnamed protein product [Amoebophrya sp. A120]|nr:unnamed protein product [Amoebophrya sp. A120]|eukprot:GSA120T00012182001.1